MAGSNNWSHIRRTGGYRSGLEREVCTELERKGAEFGYEPLKVPFVQPAKNRKYTPDVVLDNGIVVEIKGRFTSKARRKMLLVQKQHPDLEIRFVFGNSRNRISKRSKTTYAMWCQRHGFVYADKVVPTEWLELDFPESRGALAELMED